jgi:hypothetical protein
MQATMPLDDACLCLLQELEEYRQEKGEMRRVRVSRLLALHEQLLEFTKDKLGEWLSCCMSCVVWCEYYCLVRLSTHVNVFVLAYILQASRFLSID